MDCVLSFLCHLVRVGEPVDQLSPCFAVEVSCSHSLDNLLMVFHAFLLLCVQSVDSSGFSTAAEFLQFPSESLLPVSLLNGSFSNCIL